MPSDLDYALFSTRVYDASKLNKTGVPAGWTELRWQPDVSLTGFSAGGYRRGSEVVIAYTGTNDKNLDWLNSGLAVTGLLPAPQIFDAMRFYLDVKAANPDATSFTFTGHSLGGGLAALMGVFFGRQAVTFDQAPFENSAESSLLHPDVAANLKQYLLDKTLADPGQATARDTLVSSLSKFQSLRQANGGIPNSNLVSTIRVDGEFLGTLPFDPIGAPATTLTHGSYFAPIDLHSQALLTTFLQSDAFRQMTSRLPELLGMVFDSSLFEYTTDTSNTRDRNLLEHLIRHQADVRDPATGTVSIAADAMLDRFTSDLDKLVRAQGGSQGYRDLGKALIAFAMEKYYTETTDSPKFHQELFRVVTGGLQFDTKDIAVDITTAKGYSQYFANYLDTGPLFTFEESRLIKQKIADLRDWSIQGANYPLDQDRSMVTDLMALQTDARDMDGNNDTLWRIAA